MVLVGTVRSALAGPLETEYVKAQVESTPPAASNVVTMSFCAAPYMYSTVAVSEDVHVHAASFGLHGSLIVTVVTWDPANSTAS